jgi:hypothetical protein
LVWGYDSIKVSNLLSHYLLPRYHRSSDQNINAKVACHEVGWGKPPWFPEFGKNYLEVETNNVSLNTCLASYYLLLLLLSLEFVASER